MNEINPNQEQPSGHSNLQEIKDVFSETLNTNPDKSKMGKFSREYIIVILLLILTLLSISGRYIVAGRVLGFVPGKDFLGDILAIISYILVILGLILTFISYILVILLPLMWFFYWIFKFYKKISWLRYVLSVLSLFIVTGLSFFLLIDPTGNNPWILVPINEIIGLIIIWTFIIVPIFILYHYIKYKLVPMNDSPSISLDNKKIENIPQTKDTLVPQLPPINTNIQAKDLIQSIQEYYKTDSINTPPSTHITEQSYSNKTLRIIISVFLVLGFLGFAFLSLGGIVVGDLTVSAVLMVALIITIIDALLFYFLWRK